MNHFNQVILEPLSKIVSLRYPGSKMDYYYDPQFMAYQLIVSLPDNVKFKLTVNDGMFYGDPRVVVETLREQIFNQINRHYDEMALVGKIGHPDAKFSPAFVGQCYYIDHTYTCQASIPQRQTLSEPLQLPEKEITELSKIYEDLPDEMKSGSWEQQVNKLKS